jgi:hypothetical protein
MMLGSLQKETSMKKFVYLILLLQISVSALSQQNKLTGKIINEKNEPLSGVSIAQENGTGTTSDIDGNFSVSFIAGKKFNLSFSAVGYVSKTVEVNAEGLQGELIVTLAANSKKLDEVVIKSTSGARRESTNSLIAYQRNTNTVAQVVSSESIRRSPDKNTGDVLKRVPGTSIQEGKYLVVRGLADRYNQAMLNGVLLSSTEPDRKTFSYDIFPAAMLDNMIINKAFVPELPGEWAGGLVQVNTKDIPSSNFLNIQIGTGFNSQTIGNNFLTYRGGKSDWIGIDDGSRAIPASVPVKTQLAKRSSTEQAAFGKMFSNIWTADRSTAPLNTSFQIAGGFNTKVFGKKTGAMLALTYNKTNKQTDYRNLFISNEQGDFDFVYSNTKYSQDVLAGGLANFSVQLNSNNKISIKNLLNVNSTDYVTDRSGKDFILGSGTGVNIKATELGFRQNIYFNTQLQGEHNIIPGNNGIKLKWFGSFNILDQYIPDQRRLQYFQDESLAGQPYLALVAGGNSQKSGSRFFSMLNDYIYNGGGDVAKGFDLFGFKQTIKGGYAIQVKDRLFDGRPFYYQIERDPSQRLVKLPADQIFAPENITGQDGGVVFGELEGSQYRYMANTILNAGFIQFDNQLAEKLRLVWGVRYEHFDQLVGSPKQSDPRHVHSVTADWLPGLNLTYKLDQRTNIRVSGSQTVVRPEFRELSPFAFYDFELGATVVGNKKLQRTRITNLDARYELYPRAGELFTFGLFYKYFENPIELYFNTSGAGSSNTFNFSNVDHATGFGAEFEMRKKLDAVDLLKNFTVTGNLSYIFNKVKGENVDRPMQGQSPYLLNFGLQYDLEKPGIAANLLFNRIGRRILFVGNLQQSTGVGVPEIWENPRSLLDFQLSKKILKKKGEMKINVSDMLNQAAVFYHDLDRNKKYEPHTKDVVAIRRKFGTNYSISFAYNIK